MPARRTAGPAVEPITLAEAKLHLRVDLNDDDALITRLITAVREHCERRLRRTLVDSTWVWTGPRFEAAIALPWGPLRSVTHVRYLDEAGAEQTVAGATYVVDEHGTPPRVLLASGATWPATRPGAPDAVRITYQAGYGDVVDGPPPAAQGVPAPLVEWMLLQLAHFYDNRSATSAGRLEPLPYADGLLHDYRLIEI
ncbi:MAG: head-tail connector protein [Rubrivivax sp.]|nr:head-tail connector protein [Rubrivivax sp.]